MRPGAGPPAEPASQLTRITAARRPQRIRRNGGERRAASASARGPRPHSLTRSVSRTNLECRKMHHLYERRDAHVALRSPQNLNVTSSSACHSATLLVSDTYDHPFPFPELLVMQKIAHHVGCSSSRSSEMRWNRSVRRSIGKPKFAAPSKVSDGRRCLIQKGGRPVFWNLFAPAATPIAIAA